ncbi:MAG: hypothetical protein KGD68_00475 [Candidatus Lokiarchaeota archaeon]|nr:hypothetical protein [Candidatus Lokiarchaeota archaeon]
MRNQPLYILTENLNFFYIINERLIEKRIKAEILNPGNKIPNTPSIILTTRDEFEKYYNKDLKVKFLVYSKGEKIELYLLRVIAAYRIESKNNYLSLTFSIDPGKKIGLMIFLDDYYLDSFCCYEKDDLLVAIRKYIHTFQESNPNLMELTFKLGMGVSSFTYELIENIFKILHGRKNVNIFLINEYKSSKMRIIKKQKERNFSKDEISALILAFRKGIEVNKKNYTSIYKQKGLNKLQNEGVFKRDFEKIDENINMLGEIAEKVLYGEISLKESTRLINEIRYY